MDRSNPLTCYNDITNISLGDVSLTKTCFCPVRMLCKDLSVSQVPDKGLFQICVGNPITLRVLNVWLHVMGQVNITYISY